MNFFKRVFIVLLIGLPQAGRTEAANASASPALKLLAQAQVDSSGIFLDQIAVAYGTNEVLPHLHLFPAPYPGQTNSLSRAVIANFFQASHVVLPLTNWTGAAVVQVSRRTRVFEDSDLLEHLTESLQRQYVKNQGELELHLTQTWSKPEVPDEPIALEVTHMPSAGVTSSFVVGFELWAGKEQIGRWQTPLQASVWRDIPVARSTLQRGDPVFGANVTMERADVLVHPDVFLNFPVTDDSLEFTETIPAGHPLLNRDIRLRPLIFRGQLVEGLFQDGPLAISLMVETLEDGARGQIVRVRNPKTRRELSGKVENEKTVRIAL